MRDATSSGAGLSWEFDFRFFGKTITLLVICLTGLIDDIDI